MKHARPELYLVARPQLDLDAIEAFLARESATWRRTPEVGHAEELVELAGRVCYFSFSERQSSRSNDEYIRNIVDQGHLSVLEHATWSFLLTGVTRGFTHQLVRHRIGFSYSQLSQQYHDESDAEALMPAAVREDPEAAEAWERAVEQSQVAYRKLLSLLERGLANRIEPRERRRLQRTAARSVLPAATESKVLFTANARALRHFLKERGGIVGDEEMRVVSALLLRILRREAPALFDDFTEQTLYDGLPIVETTIEA